MTPRAVALAAALGACCGLLGGYAGGWLAARDPGRGRGAAGTLRGDMDRYEADGLAARASTLEALDALAGRLGALEQAAAESPSAAPDGLAELAASLSADLRALRDATVRDLGNAEARLRDLESRVDVLGTLAALAPPASAGTAPPSEEEAGEWVTLARGDPDPGRRFSALSMLGRARTDRSVHASLEALEDPVDLVVWQALRNLGRFEERGAAREIAAKLRHPSVCVRSAAYEALRRLGAPDVGFDAADLEERRREGAERLDRWVDEIP